MLTLLDLFFILVISFFFFLQCKFVPELGFRRGSYRCECKPGYYFPDLKAKPNERYYNGSLLEAEYELKLSKRNNDYDKYICYPCGPGCDECIDGRSCLFTLNWTLRTVLLVIQCIVMVGTLPLLIFTIQFSDVKVSKILMTSTLLPPKESIRLTEYTHFGNSDLSH